MTGLKNGGFEADWGEEKSHVCLVCPRTTPNYFRDVGNIFVPPGWTFWFRHQSNDDVNKGYDQPEGRDAWKEKAPERVRSGEKAYMWFTFNRRHDAGLLQQVETTPGDHLQFTVYAHAWSNGLGAEDGGRPDNGLWSDGEGVGFAHIAWEAGNWPHDTGDKQKDAIPNFTFWAGIDPTGGIDPFSDTVVWGKGYHIYNGYVQQLCVEATAEADTATVFIRSKTLWAFKHNDAYVDDAELIIVPATPPIPPPMPQRGAPRVQYARTYVLMPPSADAEWVKAAIGATWVRRRYTVGGSADDAGIGDLDRRRVIAVNPGDWEDDLGEFFTQHYPGVEYVPVQADSPAQLSRLLQLPDPTNPSPGPQGDNTLLGQSDEPWGPLNYAGGQCATFASNGCWLTCCAMALRHFGLDTDATPQTVDAAVGPGGYTDCSMRWDAMPLVGLEVIGSTSDTAAVRAHLQNGNVAFADVFAGAAKHFVLVTHSEGDSFWMYDPLRRVKGLLSSEYADVDGWRLVRPYVAKEIEFPRRGVHDLAGAEWLISNRLAGWCVEPVYLGLSPRKLDGLERMAAKDIRVLLNLRYSYARDDGGQGTLPAWDAMNAFVDACAETMRQNPAAWGFIIANEFNNPREWPADAAITPAYYQHVYNLIWSRKPAGARVIPGAIDPYNATAASWGDWRKSWGSVLDGLSGCDGIALHAYTHGADVQRIRSTQEFGDAPLLGVYYDMRVLENQQAIIPPRFAGLPQIVTETNPDADGVAGWPDSGEWVKEVADYFAERGVAGWCLFRFNHDKWRFGDKVAVLDTLRELR